MSAAVLQCFSPFEEYAHISMKNRLLDVIVSRNNYAPMGEPPIETKWNKVSLSFFIFNESAHFF